jgi:hypothetical protein
MTITGNDLLERHLSTMLAGFASSSVVIAGATIRGLLDDQEEIRNDPSGDLTRVRVRVLTLRASDVATIPARDSSLVIDGTTYTVRSVLREADGKILRLEVTA